MILLSGSGFVCQVPIDLPAATNASQTQPTSLSPLLEAFSEFFLSNWRPFS
jgi:hypothetical protein